MSQSQTGRTSASAAGSASVGPVGSALPGFEPRSRGRQSDPHSTPIAEPAQTAHHAATGTHRR